VSIDPHEIDDANLNREVEEALGDLSAGELLEMSAAEAPAKGADEKGRIRGRIMHLSGPDVFVDVGGKSEGFLTLDDFEPEQPPKIGDVHTFVMQGFDRESGLMRLSLREAKTEANWESLRIGDVLEARVTGLNIGGLELNIHGIRGFMPKSHVDLNRIEDFAPFVGHRMACEVVEIDRRGKNVTLSRRKVLERQREEARQQLRYTLAEGQVRKGVVRRLTEFGAFVDLGGIDGLLHVSDMSYARLKHPSELLKVNDEVEVQVLKIDLVKDRISLGLKQLAPDPWNVVAGNYHVSDTVDGKVTKLMAFGAFVELTPGIEGLIPVSEMSWTQRVRHPQDVLKEGDNVRVSVLAVDAENHKLTLSLKALGQDPWQGITERYAPETVTSGAVMRLTDFGAFVQLEDGIEGLVHISELSDRHVKRVSDVIQPGQVVKVRVKSVDPEQRRISLSLKGIPGEGGEMAGSGVPGAGGESATGAAGAHGIAAQGAPAPKPAAPPKKKRPLRGGLSF
jgi:small subunit ribosomal protein S1